MLPQRGQPLPLQYHFAHRENGKGLAMSIPSYKYPPHHHAITHHPTRLLPTTLPPHLTPTFGHFSDRECVLFHALRHYVYPFFRHQLGVVLWFSSSKTGSVAWLLIPEFCDFSSDFHKNYRCHQRTGPLCFDTSVP